MALFHKEVPKEIPKEIRDKFKDPSPEQIAQENASLPPEIKRSIATLLQENNGHIQITPTKKDSYYVEGNQIYVPEKWFNAAGRYWWQLKEERFRKAVQSKITPEQTAAVRELLLQEEKKRRRRTKLNKGRGR